MVDKDTIIQNLQTAIKSIAIVKECPNCDLSVGYVCEICNAEQVMRNALGYISSISDPLTIAQKLLEAEKPEGWGFELTVEIRTKITYAIYLFDTEYVLADACFGRYDLTEEKFILAVNEAVNIMRRAREGIEDKNKA